MKTGAITRRMFLALGTGLLALGCPPRIVPRLANGVKVYRRSGRGLHVSNAAKKHNANRLYRTIEAAERDAPHPGDNSKVVEVTINRDYFNELFASGREYVDLRQFNAPLVKIDWS